MSYLKNNIIIIFIMIYPLFSQETNNSLKVFGYFQNSFGQITDENGQNYNSFNMQQLNILFQKNVLEDWTAFMNFQTVNNFSAERQWGSFSIEEAWLRYRYDDHLNIKLGLQIPVFNRLNEVKNRTPLLPYVILPLVYEDSFSEDVDIESYIPKRAFVQVYGFIPFFEEFKLDYAFYLGNSPNISKWGDIGNSGQDTTDTFLSGGRIGIRYSALKIGFSYTSDKVLNFAWQISDIASAEDQKILRTTPIHRTRIGFDLYYEIGDWSLASEFIDVLYDDDNTIFDLSKRFYYGTLGYELSDELFGYFSYWFVKEEYEPVGTYNFRVITPGLSYNINEIITLKAQYARVMFDASGLIRLNSDFNYYTTAVSVYF
jgi:hypothetical protein